MSLTARGAQSVKRDPPADPGAAPPVRNAHSAIATGHEPGHSGGSSPNSDA
ncbi:uncharacterized protein OE_3686A1F [Halobacterium salinarum R1]|uniref:Uncharacterized protein n=3 Tax=Halobacterium salinarum TaxID=2242 RepID=A0A510N7X8_HALSA|nr:uncharacterized protein HBSAL_09700 [Halobacterium salinarum]CAP14395.1 uncharacterized protein OE_3686A1F [Halobacterium salinarum R1]DAC78838.1 TPA_inf: uncharacterized protein VNG_1907a [Halobacterium salinarum NRC-1]